MTALLDFPDTTTDTWTLAALVEAGQRGDHDALGEIVRRFEGMVLSVAQKRLGDWAEAQELAQEVFLRASQRLHQLERPEALGGWLRAITVRMAINRQVRRGPDIATEPQTLADTCAAGDSPLEDLLARERAEVVHAGLNRLADLDRQTLVAFYLRGESLVEMSAAFAAPVGTIKRRLHVARKRLARELEVFEAV